MNAKNIANKIIFGNIVGFPEDYFEQVKERVEFAGYVLILTDVWQGQMRGYARTQAEHKEIRRRENFFLMLNSI